MNFSVFFNNSFPPDKKAIAVGESIEASDVSKFFSGRNVREITLDELKSNYPHDAAACLAFMTPLAFAYFLPSFMRIALEDYGRADVIPEVVIGYLLAMADGRDMARRDVIEASYSRDQLGTVAKFLREMSDKYWYQYPSDDAQKALSSYWGQFEG